MAFLQILCVVLLVGVGLDTASACQPRCHKCPPIWTFYKGSCYRLFATKKSQPDAEKHCRQFSAVGQGHLASIASAEENDILLEMWDSVRGTTAGGLWIGFTDEAEEGNFIWNDGSAVSYTKWKDGQPNNAGDEHCTQMLQENNGEWSDFKCFKEYSYMCKMTATE
ncbi:alpha-N-acetylgalactosamine-specific lectin-like [Patiria miniata]|uniref:C-type lectin domain-containing protein n=1 Tax=Patiria miniata TaxID=46514 RepID=A0A914ARV1_PATMI|nr:alpha-N-acetylgalactosamine-specific lectin-like [Patiria miniata]